MKISRRESIQLSAGALASLSGLAVSQAAAQTAPAGLAETQLRNISSLPLKPDGSAPEYTPQEAGTITGVLWRTKNQTPEIEFDYRKMKIKLDARGTAKLSGTLTFPDLEKLPRHSYVTLLQCGAATPRGIVKWTGVRFSDFADMLGLIPGAHYCRLIASDRNYIDEDVPTLRHPQVMLAWLMNDAPIPPNNGAPRCRSSPLVRALNAILHLGRTHVGGRIGFAYLCGRQTSKVLCVTRRHRYDFRTHLEGVARSLLPASPTVLTNGHGHLVIRSSCIARTTQDVA